jgi:hypothetical protein
MSGLDNKVVLVTGSSRGIGAEGDAGYVGRHQVRRH